MRAWWQDVLVNAGGGLATAAVLAWVAVSAQRLTPYRALSWESFWWLLSRLTLLASGLLAAFLAVRSAFLDDWITAGLAALVLAPLAFGYVQMFREMREHWRASRAGNN